MAWRVSADPVKNESAIEWFRKKVPLTRKQWDQLVDDAKRRAFTVSSVARLDVIADTLAALDRAIAEGATFQEFKEEVAAKLTEEWQGTVKDPAWRLETIFRTNVQSAYSAGRYEQMSDPEVVKFRPYFMFDAIIDDRTTNECKALHGVIRPQDDPYWEGRIPPLHFNCRSGLRSLRKSQAERRGITENPPPAKAAEGFGAKPQKMEWSPDVESYPPELQTAAKRIADKAVA